MKTKNILFTSAMIMTILSSCGGSDTKEEEKKDPTLCECNDLKEKYPSKEDAEKEAGKETIEKCVELFEKATDEDFEKCK